MSYMAATGAGGHSAGSIAGSSGNPASGFGDLNDDIPF
jgi:hypothetical protein